MIKKIKSVNRKTAIIILILSLTTILFLSMDTVSADPSIIYVNGTGGNDSWDGENPTWNGTSGPKLSIKNASDTVNNNGTVNIANGTYKGALNRDIGFGSMRNVTIIGDTGTIIDAENLGKIFQTDGSVTLKIINITFINAKGETEGAISNAGILTIENCNFTNNTAIDIGDLNYSYGGAIVNAGNCNVVNSTFSRNHAFYGGAINNEGNLSLTGCIFTDNNSTEPGFWGGAITNRGTCIITNCTFINNNATSGGAISNTGNLTATNSTFTNNTAFSGGAISNENNNLLLENCNFNINNAPWGGAINNYAYLDANNCNFTGNHATSGGTIGNSGNLTITNSSFTNNTATGTYSSSGGAIFSNGGNVNLSGVIFINNEADRYGGAFYNEIGVSSVDNCTFTNNTALLEYGGAICNISNMNVTKSAFLNNSAAMGGAIYNEDTLNLTDSNFNNNNAVEGGAIYNSGSTWMVNNCTFNGNTADIGGVIENRGYTAGNNTIFINNCVFINNSAVNYGSVIYNEGELNVTCCDFRNNEAPIGVIYSASGILNVLSSNFQNNEDSGAIYNGEIATIHFNRFIANGEYEIINEGNEVDAENNWWGSYADPTGRVLGVIDFNPWIVLKIRINPSTITTYGNSTITADLTWNSYNEQPSGGYVPNVYGFYSFFEVSPGSMGNFTYNNISIVNGTGNATFNSNYINGTATIISTVDTRSVDTQITINLPSRNDIYVSSSTGNDTNGDGSPEHPYQTLNKAIVQVSTNGRVRVASGTYSGPQNRGITITKSISIFRDLWQDEDYKDVTIDADGYNRIFTINSGYTVTLENLTFTEGSSDIGGAILNYGTLNIGSCVFIDNEAEYGGAIMNYHRLSSLNCTFTGNIATDGGAIYCEVEEGSPQTNINLANFTSNTAHNGNGGAIYFNSYALNIRNSNFDQNTADLGGAVYNYQGLLDLRKSTFTSNFATYDGGAIYNNGTISASNSTFTENYVDNNGGVIYNRGTMSVLSNNFEGNTAGADGGAIYTETNAEIHFNRIVGNSPENSEICCEDYINPDNNWWGSNEDPTGKIAGKDVEISSWLVLKIEADADTITPYNNSTITVDLTWNSDNEQPEGGYVPIADGFYSFFEVTPSSMGNFSSNDVPIINGTAIIIFTANYIDGNATVYATVDLQTIDTQITILPTKNDIFIAPWGSDITGNGSYINPYKTIIKGLYEVNSNGRVHILNGIYSGSNNCHITINKNVFILGESQTGTIIDAEYNSRIFTVNSNFSVLIQNLTFVNGVNSAIINNGNLNVIGCKFANNYATYGSAIYNTGGLNVTGSTFINNTATSSGAIYNTGTLDVTGSIFIGNNATYSGGAIYNMGVLNVTESIFSNNIALNGYTSGYGGAIYNTGTLNVTGNFTNNTAKTGGAIYNDYNDSLNVTGSIFIGNNATYSGGAIENYGGLSVTGSIFMDNNATYSGGAIRNAGDMNVTGSTFTNNTAVNGDGGAIYNAGTLNVTGSIFTNNTAVNGDGGAIYNAGTLDVNGNTFVNNTAYWGGAIYNTSGLNVTTSAFNDNTATSNGVGGAIYNDSPLNVVISSNTFKGNTAGYSGGAIFNGSENGGGLAEVNFNVIVGNNNYDVYNYGSIDAENNWWGTNFEGTDPVTDGRINNDISKWIVLSVIASPNNVTVGGISNITADLGYNSWGEDTLIVYGELVPVNGLSILFAHDSFGNLTTTSAVFNNINQAKTVFTGVTPGLSIVNAILDNQISNATIDVISVGVLNEDTLKTFSTIQAAINDSETLNGHRILVSDGTYTENVVVNKGLLIYSVGNVIIQALNPNDPVFTILSTGNGSTILGFIIKGSSNCEIYIDGSNGNTILNNTIDGDLGTSKSIWGICLVNSNQNNLTNNTVIHCEEGINFYNSHNNTIANNTAKDSHWDNIALNLSTLNILTGNTITNADSGIRLIGGSNNNTISNNNLNGNIWTSISLVSSQYNQMTSNDLSNCQEGTYLYASNNNTINNNTANYNIWDGIAIHDSNYNTITGHTSISGNNCGIRIIGSSSNNEVLNNTINSNSWCNLSIDSAINNKIYNNTLNGANVGIYLQGASNNQIYNNTIRNNSWDGLDILFNSNNNTIQNNTIENSYYGERIVNSNNNTSYRNNYINNTVHANDNGTNTWDNGTTGNYWNNWHTTSPRPIDGGSNYDYHPSLTPF